MTDGRNEPGDLAKDHEEVTRREAMVARLVEEAVIGRQSRRTSAPARTRPILFLSSY